MARRIGQLAVSTGTAGAAPLLTVEGVLDSSTYLTLRNYVVKAALDEPAAVLVDVTALQVPSASAWSVFTSARWHVSAWPDVPIALVCAHSRGRDEITRHGVARFVPVYPSVEEALTAVGDDGRSNRRRTRAELPASAASLRRARDMVAEHLTAWRQTALIPVAKVIVDVFVENVLRHTESSPVVMLETDGETVTVAVQDTSSSPAVRHEDPLHGVEPVSGLAVVAAVCRTWRSTPSTSGKTVWALVGPENQL